MPSNNFDFGDYIDDDNKYEDTPQSFDEHLSVRGILCMKYGDARGKAIYRTLRSLALQAAKENGGEPGLIFTDDGGHFVSFHNTAGDL